MLLTLTLIASLSLTFTSLSHPVLLVVAIIAEASLVSLKLWMFMKSAWYSFILFLIFLGGIMVLFVYITSLASNEKMNLHPSPMNIIVISILLTWMTLTPFIPHSISSPPSMMNMTEMIFTALPAPAIIIIITYLLITLIAVVKMTTKVEAPLRMITK